MKSDEKTHDDYPNRKGCALMFHLVLIMVVILVIVF